MRDQGSHGKGGGCVSLQGCQGSGGWVCQTPRVSGQEGGGYVKDQVSQG